MTAAERTRILEMLKNGIITVEEAEKLLSAVDASEAAPAQEHSMFKDSRGRKPKNLRILVDAMDVEETDGHRTNAKVNVSIPLSLVKALGPIVSKSVPKDTRDDLTAQGIDISEIIEQVTLLSENAGEDMVNIDVNGGENENAKVRIYVE